ncbi:hypothetical protein B0H14DRAFT_2733225 [Mycena olivaceomarginata]|nr:hypothetical protein B0H14DRAFT_2733225 [Mycena olivaceomarginata]
MPVITIFGANGTQGSEVVFGTQISGTPEVFPADPKGAGELTQGKNLVDAAKEVGVKFFIWRSESNGRDKHIYHVDNNAVIEFYLTALGVPFAVLLTGWFAKNLYKLGALQKTDTGYSIPIAKFGPEDTQTMTWVAHDLGQAAVALLTNYSDTSKRVLGKSYPVVSFRPTYPEFAAAIAKAIKKEANVVALESAGLLEFDEMVPLGVKFGTVEEFIQKEVEPRFAQGDPAPRIS